MDGTGKNSLKIVFDVIKWTIFVTLMILLGLQVQDQVGKYFGDNYSTLFSLILAPGSLQVFCGFRQENNHVVDVRPS